MITTIVVRNRPLSRGAIFYHEPAIVSYTGDVIPNPEWVASDCITITGDRWCPIRIIKKEDILEGIDVEAPQFSSDDLICNVQGSKGSMYVVNRTHNVWSCTCKGFEFRKDCKHIRQVKNTYLSQGPQEVRPDTGTDG